MSDYQYRNITREHHRMVNMMREKQKDLWRVHFHSSGNVELLFIGLHGAASNLTTFESAAELPEWALRRIAVLNVFGDDYPTDYVDGVGRRINERTYYVEE